MTNSNWHFAFCNMESSQTRLTGTRRKRKRWRKEKTPTTKTTDCHPGQERSLAAILNRRPCFNQVVGGQTNIERVRMANCWDTLLNAYPDINTSEKRKNSCGVRLGLGRTCFALFFLCFLPMVSCCQTPISSLSSPQNSDPQKHRTLVHLLWAVSKSPFLASNTELKTGIFFPSTTVSSTASWLNGWHYHLPSSSWASSWGRVSGVWTLVHPLPTCDLWKTQLHIYTLGFVI